MLEHMLNLLKNVKEVQRDISSTKKLPLSHRLNNLNVCKEKLCKLITNNIIM